MYFRAQKKLAGSVSLSDAIDSDQEGNSLSLMDVISVDDNMLEELDAKDACVKVRSCVNGCLDEREREIIILRYGLDQRPARTQREIAAQCGISRSYSSVIIGIKLVKPLDGRTALSLFFTLLPLPKYLLPTKGDCRWQK